MYQSLNYNYTEKKKSEIRKIINFRDGKPNIAAVQILWNGKKIFPPQVTELNF